MVSRLGSKIMLVGIVMMFVLGIWTFYAYASYSGCVGQILRGNYYESYRDQLSPAEYQSFVERVILSRCSTNGMEITGVGVFAGLVVFVIGAVKKFLDKRPAEIFVREGDTIMGDKKVEVSVGDGTTIHGDFVVANSIKDSFNRVDSAEIPGNLKKSLKALSIAVGKMSEKLPKDDAEKVARDLETLTSEAISEKPRQKWWELSIEGLKEAAKNVGEIGKPVIELATNIAIILSELK